MMNLELLNLVMLCFLGDFCASVSATCPLLSTGLDCRDLVAGTSHYILRCRVPLGVILNDEATINFYKVEDGGQYDSSHLIDGSEGTVGAAGRYEINGISLTLVNITSLHEGRYYCEYDGKNSTIEQHECITVRGKAQMPCQDHSNTDCDSTCIESLQTNSDNLVLNTTIQFVGGGKCQLEQIVTETELLKGSYTQWSCSNRTQCERNGAIEPLYITDNNFNLALGNLREEDSREYKLRVRLRGNNEQSVCFLKKSFNVTVTTPNKGILNDTNTTSPTVTVTTQATTLNGVDNYTTTDTSRVTIMTQGITSQPLVLAKDHVIGITVGFSLIILILIIVLAVVIIAHKMYRKDYTYNSKSAMKVTSLNTFPHSPSTYSVSIYDGNMESFTYNPHVLSAVFFSQESINV